jgi:hypothetical protein
MIAALVGMALFATALEHWLICESLDMRFRTSCILEFAHASCSLPGYGTEVLLTEKDDDDTDDVLVPMSHARPSNQASVDWPDRRDRHSSEDSSQQVGAKFSTHYSKAVAH